MTSSGMPDLPELKRVTTADVHKADTRVGTLIRSPAGEVTFAYLTGHRGDAVASTLPLDVGPVTRPGGGLPRPPPTTISPYTWGSAATCRATSRWSRPASPRRTRGRWRPTTPPTWTSPP